MRNTTIGILGAGNMATAILNGMLNCGVIAPENIIVSDIDEEKLKCIREKGVLGVSDSKLLFKKADFIILAIKPQVANAILGEFSYLASGKKIISIMAGITISAIKQMLGDVRVTRIMPNTPCLVGQGMCAIDASDFNDEDKSLVMEIFGSLGQVVELNESLFHAVTAISGSGPAYIYMFLRGMIRAGVGMGLDEKTARMLAVQTMKGGAEMATNGADLDILIKNVCSPGGTTIEAVNYYTDNNLENIIEAGMKKCEKRSKELSKNA